jgi:hypothetical protein
MKEERNEKIGEDRREEEKIYFEENIEASIT